MFARIILNPCNYFFSVTGIGPGVYWLSQCGVGDSVDVVNTTEHLPAEDLNGTAEAVTSFKFAVGGPSQLIGRGD